MENWSTSSKFLYKTCEY